jgi:TolB protein
MLKNLETRLKKKFFNTIIAGALSFGLFFGCKDKGVEPLQIVPNQKPIAQFVASPKRGNAPLRVNFDGSASYDKDGTISKYYWSFGDGNIDSTSGAKLNYIYKNSGNYTASLDVFDNNGEKSDKALENIIADSLIIPVQPEQIAFWSDMDAGSGEIYIGDLVNDSLVNIKRLTNNKVNDVYPSFSPDGERIVFASNREESMLLWIMYANGLSPYKLTYTNLLKFAISPFWSKNGKIFFNYCDLSSIQGIACINPDATGFEKITEESFKGSLSGRPAVSPDCSQIAFVSFRDGNKEIYIANSDGTNQRNLTNNPASDAQPFWSPDKNFIYFISDRTGILEIFSQNLDNNAVKKITDYGEAFDPALSQDGKYLIFTGTKEYWYFLYLQNLDNGKITRLTFDGIAPDGSPIAYRFPVWRPHK